MEKFSKLKTNIPFLLLPILWSFFQITGFLYSQSGDIVWSLPNTIFIILGSILAGLVIGTFVYYLLDKFTLGFSCPSTKEQVSFKILLFSGLFIFACWFIAFLAYFPGICSYDFSIQMGQVESSNYTDHHPLVHTLLIQFFWTLGRNFFDSGTLGIAFYTLFQMLFLLTAILYGIYLLLKTGKNLKIILIFVVFSGLFPPNVFMSISGTKDTIFATFVLLFLLSIIFLFYATNNTSKKKHIILLIISGMGIVFFRNNGKYALLALLGIVLLLLIFDKEKCDYYKTIFLPVLLSVVIATLGLSALQTSLNCTQGDRREMLSVPIQQWARIVNYHEDELAPETYQFITQCIAEEGLLQYDPYISDPVKRHTNTTAILQNAGTFVKTYIQLFFLYPDEYINAVLMQNSGFTYMGDTSHAWINYLPEYPGYGYIQTRESPDELADRDIYKASFIPWLYDKLQYFANENIYLYIPLLNIIMAPPIYLGIHLFILGYALLKKHWEVLVPMSFLAGYYLTMFLGPTVQLRYVYPVMLCTPFIIVLYFSRKGHSA